MRIESLLRPLFSSRTYRGGTIVAVSLLLAAVTVVASPTITVNLNPGDSINLESLVANDTSVQVGDKLFSDFQFSSSNTGGSLADNLSTTAINVTALSNPFGFGISFSGPFITTNGSITEDVVLKYSVMVTDPHQLISDVHLGFNGTVVGTGVAKVTEQVMTNGFGMDTIALLDVYNQGTPNPVFNDVALLLLPTEKLFIQKDIIFGGGGSLSIIDQNFSQVPEPSTLLLAGVGCAALVVLRRRKRTTMAS